VCNVKLLPRKQRFFIIQHLLLPLAFLVSRVLNATYRIEKEEWDKLLALYEHERLLVGTCHGNLLALIPLTRRMVATGRPLTVLASPSRDGRIGEAVLRRLGARSVSGSSASRAIAGAAEFARSVQAGEVGFLTLDGPRGPRFTPKPGGPRIAQMAGARFHIIAVNASRSKVFASWDRMFLPLPFARLSVDVREFSFIDGEEEAALLDRLAAELRTQCREIGSPIYLPGKDGP
jgi:lysophospholipid acyltransferase (LPLAT)-like uncharacterized protein